MAEFGYVKPVFENNALPGSYRPSGVSGDMKANPLDNEIAVKEGSRKVKPADCQTCKDRKYVDGSDEGDVSFKAPSHISPENSAAAVMSHEQEHVTNARQEGNKENTRLLSASISLKLAVCPECGRSYVAGGTTRTRIEYTKENPYDKMRQKLEGDALSGAHIDMTADGMGRKEAG